MSDETPEMFKNLKIIDPNEKIIYCKKCVVSNQRPRVHFNEDGICGQCLYAEFKQTMIDWDKREKELESICDKFRSNDGSWDVITNKVEKINIEAINFILNIYTFQIY